MNPETSDEEFRSVSALDAPERYVYFVKRVCETGIVWALRATDGFVLMADESGDQYVPVWPAARFAAAYASPGELPEQIPLAAWMERWLPGLERDRSGIAVFPVEGCSGEVVDLDTHRSDLEAGLHHDH